MMMVSLGMVEVDLIVGDELVLLTSSDQGLGLDVLHVDGDVLVVQLLHGRHLLVAGVGRHGGHGLAVLVGELPHHLVHLVLLLASGVDGGWRGRSAGAWPLPQSIREGRRSVFLANIGLFLRHGTHKVKCKFGNLILKSQYLG